MNLLNLRIIKGCQENLEFDNLGKKGKTWKFRKLQKSRKTLSFKLFVHVK